MAASSTDKISKTSTGDIAAVATVTAPRASGVTTLSVDTQLNWPTDTGIKFSTFKIDSSNKKIANSQIDWRGVSNGSNAISNIARTGGAADTGNAAGDKVVMIITAQWGEDIAEALLVSHSQTGALLPTAVQTALGTGSITPDKLTGGSSTMLGAWQNWTPVWSGSLLVVGNGTMIAKYIQVGKLVSGYVLFTMGSTSAVTGTTVCNVPVPVAANMLPSIDYIPVGLTRVYDNGGQAYDGATLLTNSSGAGLLNPCSYNTGGTYASSNIVNQTTPIGTWTINDKMHFTFSYEAA
jgi:hypothetical protein